MAIYSTVVLQKGTRMIAFLFEEYIMLQGTRLTEFYSSAHGPYCLNNRPN